MHNIKFEKVIKYEKDDTINLPKRQTYGSAGYDFEAAEDAVIKPDEVVLVKTGIKAEMPKDTALIVANRSSGPKRGIILANGIGLIDSDYYGNPSNDGEIMFAFITLGNKEISINKGDRIGQGFFIKLLFADTEEKPKKVRNDGFGSTKLK